MPITKTRSQAVRQATTGHRPNNPQATCLCGQPWTREHFADQIREAAGGATVTIIDNAEWEIDLDE